MMPSCPRLVLALWSFTWLACGGESSPARDAPPLSTDAPSASEGQNPGTSFEGGDCSLHTSSSDGAADTAMENGDSADLAMADHGAGPDIAVYASCDDVPTASFVPDDQLDAVLARLTGAPCVGDLSCQAGAPQSCGDNPGNEYSAHAIGCTCADGHFFCHDYRKEARDCAGFRHPG